MKCLICGSENLETRDTIISDFVMARIDPQFEPERKNRRTKLCFCRDCTFAFYAYRFTPEEESLLYRNYRDAEYQQTREKYECWYTKRVNDAINSGKVEAQQKRIKKMLARFPDKVFRSVLDYGGNQGTTFYDGLGTEERYVFDISEVVPLPGINGIRDYNELLDHRYDFIMCNMVFEHLANPYEVLERLYAIGNAETIYYMEVPSENPFLGRDKFSILNNLPLLLDWHYSWYRLAKYYFQQRKQPFMPMKEHINFFTPKSFKEMAEKTGFSVMDIQESGEGSGVVLSMLFRKKSI